MRIDVKGTIIPNDYAWIYEYMEMECTYPKYVDERISEANGEPLDVYIDSGGGDIFAGSAIYSALRSYKGEVNIHVVGLAASAASVIACAGKSDIAPTAMIMVHNVSATSNGDYHDMDKSSDTLKKANRAIASAYVEKTGMSEAEALDLMDGTTWMCASEAVERGLIDRIAEKEISPLVASVSGLLPPTAINKLKNVIKNSNGDTDITGFDADKSDFLTAKAKLKLLKMKGGI